MCQYLITFRHRVCEPAVAVNMAGLRQRWRTAAALQGSREGVFSFVFSTMTTCQGVDVVTLEARNRTIAGDPRTPLKFLLEAVAGSRRRRLQTSSAWPQKRSLSRGGGVAAQNVNTFGFIVTLPTLDEHVSVSSQDHGVSAAPFTRQGTRSLHELHKAATPAHGASRRWCT